MYSYAEALKRSPPARMEPIKIEETPETLCDKRYAEIKRRFLRINHSNNYNVSLGRSMYCYWKLHVVLPEGHPFFEKSSPTIDKYFPFHGRRFTRRNPKMAKALFCKYFDRDGTIEEAQEMLACFSNALRLYELGLI